MSQVRDALEKLDNKRSQIDQFTISVPQMAGYYTTLIAKLLNIVELLSDKTNNGEILRAYSSYTALLQAKERAGLERAMGAAGFGKGKFSAGVHKKFISFGAMQDILLKSSIANATNTIKSKLNEALSSSTKSELDKLRDLAVKAPHGADISSISGGKWFSASTNMINLLKKVEDGFVKEIITLAEAKEKEASSSFWSYLILTTVLLTVALIVSYVVILTIVPPLKRIVDRMIALTQDNTDDEVPYQSREDEIGMIAKAVEGFRTDRLEKRRLRLESEKEQHAKLERQKEVDELITNFREQYEASLQSFMSDARELQSSSDFLDTLSKDTLQQVTDTTTVTEQTTGSVQMVAAATEEMSASVSEISEQVVKTNSLVKEATTDAEETNNKVSNLAEAAEKIGSVVALIQDIAEQTNLLALNATIEAARAGESGKGFAVVASEVKELASQTAKATEEIISQISNIQSETNSSVDAIKSIADKMNEVSQYTSSISAAIEEQNASTAEISNNIQMTSNNTQGVLTNVNNLSDSVGKTQGSISDVTKVSTNVSHEAVKMAQIVEDFLTKVAKA